MTNVLLEKKGPYAVATIHRPEALNALNSQVLADLAELLDTVEADEEIRVLVITGAGEKAFVAGADIGEMSTLTKAEGEAFGKKGNDIFRRLETLPIPTIAAVNGFALGGGCELSMSCDIRICADTAVFGQPEAGLGITPGFGGTQRLARLVGPGMAKQLIYTAKNIKADEALGNLKCQSRASRVTPADRAGEHRLSGAGVAARSGEAGRDHRQERPHRRAGLQEGHQRRSAGGYGSGRDHRGEAVRQLLRDGGPERGHGRFSGKAQARALPEPVKLCQNVVFRA